ncbi:MAG: transcriptional regulator, LysR family [Clostridia bacterium]|nr:transcriptional regulator, LysR family [Clostridia bacterium]
MNLGYLKLFNTLATELSFSKAASLLYISQPAVSIQIKKLEEDLGFKLFDRVGKHLALTENGDLLGL